MDETGLESGRSRVIPYKYKQGFRNLYKDYFPTRKETERPLTRGSFSFSSFYPGHTVRSDSPPPRTPTPSNSTPGRPWTSHRRHSVPTLPGISGVRVKESVSLTRGFCPGPNGHYRLRRTLESTGQRLGSLSPV